MEDKRRPRGRYSEAARREKETVRRGAIVRFCVGGSGVFKVDTIESCQWTVKSGRRRAVERRDGEWFYQDFGKWIKYAKDIQVELELAFKESTAGADTSKAASDSQSVDAEAVPSSPEEALIFVRRFPSSHFRPEVLRACVDLALAPKTSPQVAFKLLCTLVEGYNVKFTRGDVRRAALFMGSMAILHIVISSSPALQLLGFDIFDKRYPGLGSFNDEGKKQCLKALLSRGARLGESGFVPPSKLLRKIESDTFTAWAQRYLASMTVAGMDLPDHVQKRVEAFVLPT